MPHAYLLAAIWMLYVTAVHAAAGGERVLRPVLAADLAPFPRATVVVVWHTISWWFLSIAVFLGGAAVHAPLRVFAPLVAVQLGGVAVVFLVVAHRALGSSIRLPQWPLLGPLAVVTACAGLPRGAALSLALLLGAIGLAHLAWALGAVWPARSARELSAHIIGRDVLPSFLPCAVVAAGLGGFVWAFLAPAEAPLVRPLRLAVIAVFAVRGSLGFFEGRVRPEIRGTPYALYSRFMYSPLCLLLAALGAESLA